MASTYTAAATLSLITIGMSAAASGDFTPSCSAMDAPSHAIIRSSVINWFSCGIFPAGAAKRLMASSLPPWSVKPEPFHPAKPSVRRISSAAREPYPRH